MDILERSSNSKIPFVKAQKSLNSLKVLKKLLHLFVITLAAALITYSFFYTLNINGKNNAMHTSQGYRAMNISIDERDLSHRTTADH